MFVPVQADGEVGVHCRIVTDELQLHRLRLYTGMCVFFPLQTDGEVGVHCRMMTDELQPHKAKTKVCVCPRAG